MSKLTNNHEAKGTPPTNGGEQDHGRKRTWLGTHGRDLRFLIVFGLLMAGYYFVSATGPVKNQFFPWYLEQTARLSGAGLKLIGIDTVTVTGNVLKSSQGKGAVSVERGCDALEPSALFVSAVLASPLPWLRRLSAAGLGTLLLMILNLVRIMSLYLTRVYWIKAFDVMHLDVWQSLFILLAIVLWAGWAAWESRRRSRLAMAHAPT